MINRRIIRHITTVIIKHINFDIFLQQSHNDIIHLKILFYIYKIISYIFIVAIKNN